jgi:hypothetical protein
VLSVTAVAVGVAVAMEVSFHAIDGVKRSVMPETIWVSPGKQVYVLRPDCTSGGVGLGEDVADVIGHGVGTDA